MKKLKSFSVKSMVSLSREEMARLTGGADERYHTSCTMSNIAEKCIYEGKEGVCDYTMTTDSSGNVLYYDTFCNV